MKETLATRVQARLDALGINRYEAGRRAKLERSFIGDLLKGKKSTMRPAALKKLADALECDVDYLQMVQAVPRAGDMEGAVMTLAGTAEAGAWREKDEVVGVALPLMPDPRYPADQQRTYLVRGDHAAGLGIIDGSAIIVVPIKAYREGDVVLIRRERNGAFEISVRVLSAGAFRARPAANSPAIAPVPQSEAEVIGFIAVSYRAFGLPT